MCHYGLRINYQYCSSVTHTHRHTHMHTSTHTHTHFALLCLGGLSLQNDNLQDTLNTTVIARFLWEPLFSHLRWLCCVPLIICIISIAVERLLKMLLIIITATVPGSNSPHWRCKENEETSDGKLFFVFIFFLTPELMFSWQKKEMQKRLSQLICTTMWKEALSKCPGYRTHTVPWESLLLFVII